MSIRAATLKDTGVIRDIALRTWPAAYAGILSPAQLVYMLDLMYSEEALADQMMDKGHLFMVYHEAGRSVAFAGYEPHHGGGRHTRLHKLYVLPEMQGSGAGKTLLEQVISAAQIAGDHAVELNVNRFNTARMFYEKHGFRVVRDEVIDIGGGFVMDDHVMERAMR